MAPRATVSTASAIAASSADSESSASATAVSIMATRANSGATSIVSSPNVTTSPRARFIGPLHGALGPSHPCCPVAVVFGPLLVPRTVIAGASRPAAGAPALRHESARLARGTAVQARAPARPANRRTGDFVAGARPGEAIGQPGQGRLCPAGRLLGRRPDTLGAQAPASNAVVLPLPEMTRRLHPDGGRRGPVGVRWLGSSAASGLESFSSVTAATKV